MNNVCDRMDRDTTNSFRVKTNEIAKVSILDKRTKFTILYDIWMKFLQKLVIFDGRKMKFWAWYFLCP